MTLWDLLEAARRRWYATLAGAASTCLVALWLLMMPGVYHAQVDVVFMWPQNQPQGNTFQFGSQTLIETAGVIGAIVNANATGTQAVSDTVTLVGEGVTDGWSVRLPNAGGQWAVNYVRPVLDVQASGASPAAVQRTMAAVLGRIDAALRAQQVSEGVPPRLMIRTRLSPPTPQVLYSKGSRIRTLGGALLIGVSATAAGVLALDRRLRARGAKHAAPDPEREPVPVGA